MNPKTKKLTILTQIIEKAIKLPPNSFVIWMPPCEQKYHKYVHKSQEPFVLNISHIGHCYYHTTKQISKILLSIDSIKKKSHMKTKMRFSMASLAISHFWWSYHNNLSRNPLPITNETNSPSWPRKDKIYNYLFDIKETSNHVNQF